MEHALDPEILDFCAHQNIVPSVDEASSGSESDSLEDEDSECLGTFEEIAKQSELNKFSAILKEAQWVALATEHAKPSRRPYMGHSQLTQQHRKKLRTRLASQGFLPIDQFLKWAEAKRQTARSVHKEFEESSDEGGQGSVSVHNTLDSRCLVPGSVASSHATIHLLHKESEETSDDLHETHSNADCRQD